MDAIKQMWYKNILEESKLVREENKKNVYINDKFDQMADLKYIIWDNKSFSLVRKIIREVPKIIVFSSTSIEEYVKKGHKIDLSSCELSASDLQK